ncbi:MAG: DEAD/DEAH box helicase [Pseudomonadota bacterium]|nr:MAG: DEAD/DEAH box helicase [Pseudomonadota bacterium]
MFPSIVASELQQAIHGFLHATFPMTTPGFRRDDGRTMIDDFLDQQGVLFKGPYVSLGLPFRTGEGAELPFSRIAPEFNPYRHQVSAFRRLCASPPRSTLVATGTGSGKTECFTLPILDHCAGNQGKGIKAIIIYPMNALAGDQAQRLAKAVFRYPQTRGRIRVGLYTGDSESSLQRQMSKDSVITCKETLRDSPPDILLTNYRMLDFLLMRPGDQELWKHNDGDQLRFLVVDELHTFDGAQGTDLACLIRRLRTRLAPTGDLACVGTSATIGGAENARALLDYAGEIFAADFDDDSLILEDRQSPVEFAGSQSAELREWPTTATLHRLSPEFATSPLDFLQRQAALWLGEAAPRLIDGDEGIASRIELGEQLRRHEAVRDLLERCQGVASMADLVRAWQHRLDVDEERARAMLDSLLALISWARAGGGEAGQAAPFLQVRLQLWLRELNRLTARVDAKPELLFSDDLSGEDVPFSLPVAHCRECHTSGWVGTRKPDADELGHDLQKIYRAWFGRHPDVCLMIPADRSADLQRISHLCPACRKLVSARAECCPDCASDALIRVWLPIMTREAASDEARSLLFDNRCPSCDSRDSLSLMGSRAASLASVWIGRLYASRFNDHHKLIAFSDSVQDAAHRAGFFGARTYNDTVRAALAELIEVEGEGQPLSLLAERAPRYWRERLRSDADFVGTFIAPNMTWLRDYDALKSSEDGKLPRASNLPELVERRLEWEVYQSFGLRARIGRTLERQGRAAVGLEARRLDEVAERLHVVWREEIGQLTDLELRQVRRFLAGFLWRLRTQGAFYHHFLDGLIENKGKPFVLTRSNFMPHYGMGVRPPALLTLEPVSHYFSALHREKGSWFYQWFSRLIASGEAVLATAEYRQAMTLLVKVLSQSKLLLERSVGGQSVWGLSAEDWLVTRQVQTLGCSACGHRIQVPAGDLARWNELPCLRNDCAGCYGIPEERQGQRPPSRGLPRRLVPAEHTGLLDADTRMIVERSFMQGERPWHINLLSATPTLEMGIDIGDLSTVLLCSVPPGQANYLQRIGRAGRRDGNSLALTVANGHPHDLYFHAEPERMIAGQVEPPGVFLRATAVLERQLMAWCFDRWVAEEPEDAKIPMRLGQVLNRVEVRGNEDFPVNFLDFVERNEAELFEQFRALFPDLDEAGQRHLKAYLGGDGSQQQPSLSWRLDNRLKELAATRREWSRRIEALKKRLQALEKEPEDERVLEELERVRSERSALMALRRRTNDRHTFNFFTDEGLLPNYAFPEEGVTLQSVVIRRLSKAEREEDGHTRSYQKISYEMQRPAQSALSELAPLNHFYAVGRAVQIDQVDLSAGNASPQSWRLCNQCQFMENIDANGDRHAACPRCGSSQWADTGQRQSLLKLRQVYATADDRASRIGDDSDQRTPKFYNQQMLVDIDSSQTGPAWHIKQESLPFGFEYVPLATLREVNFGEQRGQEREIAVAGELSSRPGFKVCRHCGKVRSPDPRQQRRFEHAFDCKLRRPGAVESDDDYFEALYLYRELKSEAVRILLPMSEIGSSDVRRRSLIAALQLGLRRYYRGKVDHIRVTSYAEPVTGGAGHRQYLVLYDSVPGGTGYLKELLSYGEKLMRVLEQALEVLRDCACRENPDLDGCYRCILAWRESRHMKEISRSVAEDLLGKIVEARDRLEAIEHLNKVPINALLESELEQRFHDVLAHDSGLSFKRQRVNETAGAFITVPAPEGESPMGWNLELQVRLGRDHDVAVGTDADFVLWPARERPGFLPVAVYLDGFRHHHDRNADDVLKRQAILDSGNFRVWSLNWHDLPLDGARIRNPAGPLLGRGQDSGMIALLDRLARSGDFEPYLHHNGLIGEGPFAWLLLYLSGRAEALDRLRQAAFSRAFGWLRQDSVRQRELRRMVCEEVVRRTPWHLAEAVGADGDGSDRVFGGLLESLGTAADHVAAVAALPQDAMRRAMGGEIEALSRQLHLLWMLDDRSAAMDERFEAAWAGFWGASNLLQFLDHFSLLSADGVDRGLYTAPMGLGLAERPVSSAWSDLAELSLLPGDEIEALERAGFPVPESGLEIRDASGAVIAELELAWPDQKVAVVLEADDRETASKQGWNVLDNLDANSLTRLERWLVE